MARAMYKDVISRLSAAIPFLPAEHRTVLQEKVCVFVCASLCCLGVFQNSVELVGCLLRWVSPFLPDTDTDTDTPTDTHRRIHMRRH